jgi:hypothetical protein
LKGQSNLVAVFDRRSQVASRYGIDLVKYLRLKEKVRSSKILTALSENTAYKLSFGITFALSAFMQF